MNRKLILGIIIVLTILIVAIVALIIAGPKDVAPKDNDVNIDNLSSDLQNLDSQDAGVLDQNLDSTIIDLGE